MIQMKRRKENQPRVRKEEEEHLLRCYPSDLPSTSFSPSFSAPSHPSTLSPDLPSPHYRRLSIPTVSSRPLPWIILPILLLSIFTPSVFCFDEVHCGTLDMRNNPFQKINIGGGENKTSKPPTDWRKCSVLEGSLLMSMMNNGNFTEKDFIRFENLVEITGSVLIFQVRGIKSLKWIFPKLRVIGGQNLIQHYSLIVYQNDDLEELGLDNLRIIRNGGVRIAENRKMCNARSIDWKRLQHGPINDVLVDDTSDIGVGEGMIAACPTECVPPEVDPSRCHRFNDMDACWSPNTCQSFCPFDREPRPSLQNTSSSSSAAVSPFPLSSSRSPSSLSPSLPLSQLGPGCSDRDWSRCHPECIAGCTKPGDPSACYACRSIRYKGSCTTKCPAYLFNYMDRRCITRDECEKMGRRGAEHQQERWRAFDGKCHYHCPDNYEEDPANDKNCRRCVGECQRKCVVESVIDSLAKAKQLSRCSVIDGNLEIEMRIGMDSVPAEELTAAFSKIQQIEGYLLIRLSTAFVNLNMFKSLNRIAGRELYRKKYSVAIYENPNLAKLFPVNANITIDQGHLQFQNNRMLCFRHIESMMKGLGREKEMNENDQSRTSNGDKAICEESSFDVEVMTVSSSSFTLKWAPYNTTDIDYRKFLGYEVMYKEVPFADPNLSIDDDRSACSDSWNSHFQAITTSVSDLGEIFAEVASKKDNEEVDDGDASSNFTSHPSFNNDVQVMISNDYIKPNTIYAFYVTTTLVRHQGARNAVSKIRFVKTLFGNPEAPKITKFETLGPDRIRLDWDAPLRPNGQITHYMVSYRHIPMSDKEKEKRAFAACEKQDHSRLAASSSPEDDVTSGGQSPAGGGVSMMMSSTASPDTCQAKGCCSCQADPKAVSAERSEMSAFENAIQDKIFVQNGGRRKRAIESKPKETKEAKEEGRRNKIDELSEKISLHEVLNEPIRVNVTARTIVLQGLKHNTQYFVSVAACQNVSAPEASCSTKKSWKSIYTDPIDTADMVTNESISYHLINGTSDVIVKWTEPEEPNGAVLAYRVKAVNTAKQATPIEQCQPATGGWSPSEDGVLFEGLNDGDYRVEIRTISLNGLSPASSNEQLFNVYHQGFWTLENIFIAIGSVLLFVAIAVAIAYYFVQQYYNKKVKEYATQLISANPEYLSQNDVYKADHWELSRGDLDMMEEIGRGTFGKVYRGYGHSVTSVCGESFGVCAIKTVAENANSAERLHFLLEASVMKQFNSSFIVKLYGVVSDGQPVLVVMEMMEKGNLRDFLRSRRPGAEENTLNLPVPHAGQYFQWAAQIADGMAYLESLRFCHRDLAARNCMVHADESVKIGDFGMARDLYYHEYYKPTGKRLMPVRWMAPESLKDGKFDTKSDVWSYGIVLYEMITLGEQPYQGLANDEVLNFIGASRKVLERPTDCPEFWHNLMVECWKYVPKERPNFHLIVSHLIPFVNDDFKKKSFVVQNPDIMDHSSSDSDEPAYVPEGHGMMRSMTICENGDGDNMHFDPVPHPHHRMRKSRAPAVAMNETGGGGWGEADSLNGGGAMTDDEEEGEQEDAL